MKKFLAFLTVVTCMLFFAQFASAQNLVTNPGFESGMTGWSGGGASPETAGYDGYTPHGGSYFASFGYVGILGSITQTLATTVGQQYDLTYYFASDGALPNQFVTTVGGQILFNQSSIPAQSWALYDYTFTATSSSTALTFSGRDDPLYLALDDVSVTSVTSAPEPTTMLLLGLGLVGLAGVRRKFKE